MKSVILFYSIIVLALIAILFPRGEILPPSLKLRTNTIAVLDGDTISFQGKKRGRLAYIDAPEKAQLSFDGVAIGLKSKEYLRLLLTSRQESITIEIRGVDRYGRFLVQLFVGDTDINYEMVKSGMALLYPFSEFPSGAKRTRYLLAYEWAKWTRQGVWAAKGFDSPYSFRKKQQQQHPLPSRIRP
ncbi:MAG: thermonuclease family protein [Oligoflexia bacterium]|nr:thermonuclease family protein [Oligoflexia bacterium]